VSYGNLLFIAGKGAHFEGDINCSRNSRMPALRWTRSSSATCTSTT
jgi:hypothetical protein